MATDHKSDRDPRLGKLIARAQAARERAEDLKQQAEEVLAKNKVTIQLVDDTMHRWSQEPA